MSSHAQALFASFTPVLVLGQVIPLRLEFIVPLFSFFTHYPVLWLHPARLDNGSTQAVATGVGGVSGMAGVVAKSWQTTLSTWACVPLQRPLYALEYSHHQACSTHVPLDVTWHFFETTTVKE